MLKSLIIQLFFISIASLNVAIAMPSPSKPLYQSLLEYSPKNSHFPESIRDLVELANKALEQEDLEKRDSLFKKLNKLLVTRFNALTRGEYDEFYVLQGYVYESSGDFENSEKSYRDSINLRSDNVLALFRYAWVLKEMNLCPKALSKIKEVIWRSDDYRHEALYLLSLCYEQLGEDELALAAINKAQSINPSYLPVLKKLADVELKKLEQENIKDKSIVENRLIDILSSIVKEEPNNREQALSLSRMLLKKGDPLYASEFLTKAERITEHFVLSSNFKDSEAAKLLYKIKLKLGNTQDASKLLEKGIEANPKSKKLLTLKKQLEIEKQYQESLDKAISKE